MPIADNLITCDTNILFYTADTAAGAKHATASLIVRELALRGSPLSLQCLNEFFSSTTRKQRLTPASAQHLVEEMQEAFTLVVPTGEDTIAAIAAYREHQISFWDALLWATARRAGCRVLLSEDMQDGRTLGGVTFRNPFKHKGRIEDLLNL